MKEWVCQFKNIPKEITVGTKMHLSCEGEIPKSLEDLSLVFSNKQDQYRLHVLKILYVEEGYLDLEVAPYRSGDFKGDIVFTDGKQSFISKDFSFSVASVLPQGQQIQPQGPFGPWKEPMPFLYFLTSGLTMALFLAISIILLGRFFNRKKLIHNVSMRLQSSSPSKTFIKNSRRLKKESSDYTQDLDKIFKIFLENLFYIPCLKKRPFQILHYFRKYETRIYKKYGKNVRQILKEFNQFQSTSLDEDVKNLLEKKCREIVFLLEEEKRA